MFRKSSYSEEDYQNYFCNPPTLKLLQIIPSRECNARCSHCFLYGKNATRDYTSGFYKNELDVISLERFINNVIENTSTPFWVMLAGGESLMYKKTPELLHFLHNKKIPTVLLTNGIKVSEFKNLICDTTAALSISLDGDSILHDHMRGVKGMFKTVTENIKDLIKEKQRRKSIFPSIQLNYAVTPYNVHCFNDYIKALYETFPKEAYNLKILSSDIKKTEDIAISFEPYWYTDKEHMELYKEQMKKYFGCSISDSIKGFVCDKINIDVSQFKNYLFTHPGVTSFIDIEKYFMDINEAFGHDYCLTPWNSIMVTNSGNAYFCPDLEDYPLGNINKNTFEEIWLGEKAEKFREQLKKGKLAFCNRCAGLYIKINTPEMNNLRLQRVEKIYQQISNKS